MEANMPKWLNEFIRSWKGVLSLETLPEGGVRIGYPDPRVVRLKKLVAGFVKSPWAVAIVSGLIVGLLVSFLT